MLEEHHWHTINEVGAMNKGPWRDRITRSAKGIFRQDFERHTKRVNVMGDTGGLGGETL